MEEWGSCPAETIRTAGRLRILPGIRGIKGVDKEWSFGYIVIIVFLNALLGGLSALVLSLVLALTLTIRYRSCLVSKMAGSSIIRSSQSALLLSCGGLAGILHYCADALGWGI